MTQEEVIKMIQDDTEKLFKKHEEFLKLSNEDRIKHNIIALYDWDCEPDDFDLIFNERGEVEGIQPKESLERVYITVKLE